MGNLVAKIEEIRATASRFYAVDLHLHSPGSYDWDNSGSEENPRDPNLDRIPPGSVIPDDVVKSYKETSSKSGRSLAAITDHNVSSFSEAVSSQNTEAEPCILPGIELSITLDNAPLIKDLRIHVLAIFPEKTHHESFARIMPSGTPAEPDRDPTGTLQYGTIDDLISRIHAEGGLAIAAHIESSNGIRAVYKNTTELMLEAIGGTPEAQEVLRQLGDQVKDELVKFDAIQVKPTTSEIHYSGPDGDLRVPLIVASDLHVARELSEEQAAKYSYVKMARPSFSSLREALKFPDVRVRFNTGLPKSRPPRLLGLRLLGGKATDKTFFKDTTLGFSDNLTCIIGPRGSGKSAAIDALRYLMGYNRNLGQINKVSDQVTDRQRYTLEKTRIEALYQAVDERVYRLVATFDAQEKYVTEVYDLDGNKLNIEDVEDCQEFPLNLFGWGELELLAENPDTQRELLDRFIPAVCGLKETKKDLHESLVDNRNSCVELARDMSRYFTDIELDFRRLNEFKDKYDELNTEEIEGLFAQLDSIKAKRKILKKVDEELQARIEEGDMASVLEIGKLLEDENVKEWAETLSARLKPERLDDWIRETSLEYQRRVEVATGIIESEDEKLARQEDSAEKEIQAVIGEEQAISGDLRNHAKNRYDTAKASHEEYVGLFTEYEELISNREEILDEIDVIDKQIFATRNQEASSISEEVSLVEDEHYQIDLVLQQQSDKKAFEKALVDGGLTFQGQWRANKRPQILSSALTPRTLTRVIVNGEVETLDGLTVVIDGVSNSLRHTDAENLIKDNTPYSEIEGLDMTRVDHPKLDKLLQLQEVSIDDAFFITLGGKPIQYCSPGQRCSAMLPIVTLTSQAPLVIDQPEDNLDNRLVSRALFKILARLKETRQIILATHNPNILVSGDAEQVLLLNADGELEKHGCIDNPGIIGSVLGLMEGGADAFERRHKKYEPYL